MRGLEAVLSMCQVIEVIINIIVVVISRAVGT